MRAPVYRSLEAKNTVLGSGIAMAAYVLIRIANYGRAEGFVQHYLQFKVRRLLSGGRLSAAARVGPGRAPRFPHGDSGYAGQDLAARLFEIVRARTGGAR